MNTNTLNIDLSYFYLLTNGNKEFEQILLTGTFADVDKLVTNLRNGWKMKDPVMVRKSAHSLIALAAIVGLPDIEAWSRKIDHAFADNVFHMEFEVEVKSIIDLWLAAVPQLKKMILAFNSYTSKENASLQ